MPSGSMIPWLSVTDSIGVRPVINLRTDTAITKGDGSSLQSIYNKLALGIDKC